MDSFKKVLYVFVITTIALSGCESLKASKAILPVKEY